MKKSLSQVRVRYQETDQMGVVYHGNYFTWFEIGRTDLLRELGYSYRQMEKKNIMLPVIEADCKYKIPAKYDDELIINTRIKGIKGIRITFEYRVIRREDQQELAVGKTIHAFVDNDLRPVNFKKLHPELYNRLLEYS